MKTPTLSIVILSYNTKALTIGCIASLYKYYAEEFSSETFEIIVVDNASTDDSVAALRKISIENPAIQVIENDKNVGFAKGCNIGFSHARGAYVLFLNSDTKVTDTALQRMIELLEKNNDIAAIGAKLQNQDGRNESSGGTFYNLLQVFFLLFGTTRVGQALRNKQNITKVDWVSGGAMMVVSDIFAKAKGFDEHFFMYVEDMELCFRLKQMGKNVYFDPTVVITHIGQGSSDRSFAIVSIYQGLLYFYKKHTSFVEYAIVKILLMIKAVIAIGIGFLTHNAYLLTTYRKALRLIL